MDGDDVLVGATSYRNNGRGCLYNSYPAKSPSPSQPVAEYYIPGYGGGSFSTSVPRHASQNPPAPNPPTPQPTLPIPPPPVPATAPAFLPPLNPFVLLPFPFPTCAPNPMPIMPHCVPPPGFPPIPPSVLLSPKAPAPWIAATQPSAHVQLDPPTDPTVGSLVYPPSAFTKTTAKIPPPQLPSRAASADKSVPTIDLTLDKDSDPRAAKKAKRDPAVKSAKSAMSSRPHSAGQKKKPADSNLKSNQAYSLLGSTHLVSKNNCCIP